jgi:cytochrome d ubiquinol oxidase subunit II
MSMDISLFYFLLLGFAILMYVILDGFDLGIGILYPWFDSDAEHDHLMRSVSHVWDGNETWLVFGGVILFGAFPAAYALLLSSLYLPIMLMLIGLIFRGVAFEYRFKSNSSRTWWSRAFSLGSTLAAACQGFMLGVIVQGVPIDAVASSSLDLVTPFSLFTALAVPIGYALLGCTYLVMKSRGAIQHKAAQRGRLFVWLVMLAMAIVSLLTLLQSEQILQRWLGGWHPLLLLPLPLLAILAARLLYQDLGRVRKSHHQALMVLEKHEDRPFWLAVTLFFLAFIGLLISLFPEVVPGQMSYQVAAAPEASLWFMLPGVLIFVPLILAYTFWGYRIFAGKVEDFEQGY